jgi:hypothetical protein
MIFEKSSLMWVTLNSTLRFQLCTTSEEKSGEGENNVTPGNNWYGRVTKDTIYFLKVSEPQK